MFSGINKKLFFLSAFINDFETVGSMWPSSEHLVNEMTVSLEQDTKEGRRILEVGAGTGVITEKILSLLKPSDTLDVVEIHPEFVKNLKEIVERSGKKGQVTIHQVGIEKFYPKKNYTQIISSLPLTNFNITLVIEIYRRFKNLLDKKGVLTYFEYQGLRARLAYCKFSGEKTHYKRLNAIKKTKENFLKKRSYKMRRVFSNLPPAKVFHVREQAHFHDHNTKSPFHFF